MALLPSYFSIGGLWQRPTACQGATAQRPSVTLPPPSVAALNMSECMVAHVFLFYCGGHCMQM